MAKPVVFMFMPSGTRNADMFAMQRFHLEATQRYQAVCIPRNDSALGKNFNHGWAMALDALGKGVTHFVMQHADAVPCRWFVDVLMDELIATGADIVSAAIDIKTRQRLISTAVGQPGDKWDWRRITAKEMTKLPETFTAADLSESLTEGGRTWLLANTGCWICDLRNPLWQRRKPDGSMLFEFSQEDRITFAASGQRRIEFLPEDYRFSRLIAEAGGTVAVTQKLHVSHIGPTIFPADPVEEADIDQEGIDFHLARKGLSQET